ncbi:MAG: hypothetical protein DSY37_01545 [Hyperthermus sp.]|nr:MAG: hypothetical protein DSY37_01545 [Hyperthermus sp.]
MSGEGDLSLRVPWLERHIELQRLAALAKRIQSIHVATSDEIVEMAGKRYRKLRQRRRGSRGKIELELRRLETVYTIAYSKLKEAARMPSIKEMGDYHKALLEAFIGIDAYSRALRQLKKGVGLVKKFWDEYKLLITTSNNPREAARFRKEGCGRILSVVRRLNKHLKLLSEVRRELAKTHVIAEGLPIVVVAGIPNAGKSTLVSKLSTAKPEIAEYPFTTKQIIVGKVTTRTPHFYIVDTPGILEKAPSKYTPIEKKAIAALKSLPDIILFLVDASPSPASGIREQARLASEIAELVDKKFTRLMIAINKIDLAPQAVVKKAEDVLVKELEGVSSSRLCRREATRISALKGVGLEQLIDHILECLRATTPWIFA